MGSHVIDASSTPEIPAGPKVGDPSASTTGSEVDIDIDGGRMVGTMLGICSVLELFTMLLPPCLTSKGGWLVADQMTLHRHHC
jgi:hypothetical protein